MVINDNIKAFIDFNYIPLSTKQCIIRLLLLWLFGSLVCCIGNIDYILMLFATIISLAITTLFFILVFRYKESKISRFLCDGITYTYLSLIANIASYKFLTLNSNSNPVLALILMLSLVFFIVFTMIFILYLIKKGCYNKSSNTRVSLTLCSLSGILGISVAKFSSIYLSQDEAVVFGSICLLVLSFLLSIPSANLLKAYFTIKINK